MYDNGTEYLDAELQEAFDPVKNQEHWKGPINAVIHKDYRDITYHAIKHFTGTEAKFYAIEKHPDLLFVSADGVWMRIRKLVTRQVQDDD